MKSFKTHIAIPADLHEKLDQHPGLNRSQIASKAFKKVISNPKTCPCNICTHDRQQAIK